MLKTPEEVYDLLIQLWKPALKRAKKEIDDMQTVADSEGKDFKKLCCLGLVALL